MEFKTCSETAVPTVTSSSEGGGGGQFIFPAIFSRQLGGFSTSQGGKLMDELRPNLGLLGLVEDHPLDKRPKTEAEFSGLYGLAEPPSRALHDHTVMTVSSRVKLFKRNHISFKHDKAKLQKKFQKLRKKPFKGRIHGRTPPVFVADIVLTGLNQDRPLGSEVVF
ncbi:unnamed protein product [Nezara viridula]|uniref:Uncharacterized protein n=1 Tax=Nezara viridula TaxID=85310 RepID=A0A9P0E5G2_NEZVI|nr:unnamed protein product [Nezara viridula]